MPQRRARCGTFDAGTASPQRVATRRLRSDYFGTEVGKHLGTVDGAFVGEVEDPQVVQGTVWQDCYFSYGKARR